MNPLVEEAGDAQEHDAEDAGRGMEREVEQNIDGLPVVLLRAAFPILLLVPKAANKKEIK